jgi:hypothetical protein
VLVPVVVGLVFFHDVRVQTMFGSSFFCLFCREFMFYLCNMHLLAYAGVQNDCHIVSFNSITTSVKNCLPEFIPGFLCRVSVVRKSFVFCVVLYRSLFLFLCPFSLATALSVLWSTASDYPVGMVTSNFS